MVLCSASSIQGTRSIIKKVSYPKSSLRHASSSTTPPAQIPPESPKYITIPRPPQIQAIRLRHMKGVLPVPRTIHRKNEQKATPKYLANVTPEPSSTEGISQAATSETKDVMEWKARQSAARRHNLCEGLVELKDRQARKERDLAAIRAHKRAVQERRTNAPEREDERLTNPSVLETMKSLGTPHTSSKGDIAKRRERYEALQARKREKRQDALHNLYVNAKDFMISMEDLNAKIEEEFHKEFYTINPEHGVWDEQGMPETTGWLLSSNNKNSKRAVGTNDGDYAAVSGERVQRVAEELTGGRL